MEKKESLIPKRLVPIEEAGVCETYYSTKHWFVGYVQYCHEVKVAEKLEKLGVEYYLPMQKKKNTKQTINYIRHMMNTLLIRIKILIY